MLTSIFVACFLRASTGSPAPAEPHLAGLVIVSAPNHRPTPAVSRFRPMPGRTEMERMLGKDRYLFRPSEDGAVLIGVDRRNGKLAGGLEAVQMLRKGLTADGLLKPEDLAPDLARMLRRSMASAGEEGRFIVVIQQQIILDGPAGTMTMDVASSRSRREVRELMAKHPVPQVGGVAPLGEPLPEPPPLPPPPPQQEEAAHPGVLLSTWNLGADASLYEMEALQAYHDEMDRLRREVGLLANAWRWSEARMDGPPQGAVSELSSDLLQRLRPLVLGSAQPSPSDLRSSYSRYRIRYNLVIEFGEPAASGSVEVFRF